MRLKRNIFLMNAQTTFSSALFILPVLLPYYRDQVGIGFKELLIIDAILAAVILILEIPSGWIADIWQRKHVIIAGSFFKLLCNCALLLAHDFTTVVIATSFLGIGISLHSGTNASMIYETLLSKNKECLFSKLEGKRIALSLYALAISGIIGGLVYPIHHLLPLVISVITMLIALVCSCLLDEPERYKKTPEHHPIKDMLITMKYALHGHTKVAFIIFFSAALICSTKVIMWTQQPYYIELGIPETWFGFLAAIGMIIGGVSSQTSHLLDGKISNNKSLALFWGIVFVVCIIAAIKVSWLGVVLLAFGGKAIFGAARPRVYEAINNQVSSARRATIFSTQNLMVSLLYIPLSTAMGVVSGAWGLQGVFIGLIIWLLIAGLFLGLLFVNNGNKNAE